jgi:hypothetical protein
MVWDLVVGPGSSADFYTSYWAYGHHFRVSRRDMTKKTTFDCRISQWFNIEGEEKEYIAYVEEIVRLDFDSFETVVIKAKWYNGNHRQGRACTILEDECGHLRIKDVSFLPDNSPSDEPFAFPKDMEQIFYVDDWIHRGWKLAIKVQPRSKKVFYKRFRSDARISGNDSEDLEASTSDNEDAGAPQHQEEHTAHGIPISVEADDSTGEEVYSSDDQNDSESDGQRGVHS